MKDLKAQITCPQCQNKIQIKIKDMVPGQTVNCSYCSVAFKFTGDDGRKAQSVINNLEKSIQQFSKEINIKF